MRQRALIAMALSCGPRLLIADEPTTALDVTVQAQVLELLSSLQSDFGMSVLLVTHDLGVVAETCDRVVVMYAGEVIETSNATSLFARPRHPYTAALLECLPGLRPDLPLRPIPGLVPARHELPAGCLFHPRCRHATDQCRGRPARPHRRRPRSSGAVHPRRRARAGGGRHMTAGEPRRFPGPRVTVTR